MSINNQQVSYSFGQMGSIHAAGTETVTTSVPDTVFVAITFLEATTFDSGAEGLVAATDVDGTTQLFPDSTYTSTSIDANGGDVVDGESFPAGITIYGRWTGFKLATGRVIAYIGH
tara:strand:- start:2429 stop:2776 length:348 start_codon:yes stop_codon:yes gene_type:complete